MPVKSEKPARNVLEENFCREYARHGNGDRAVVAAGFGCKSLKDGSTSASVMANSLLKKPKIQQRIQQLIEKRHRKADVDIEYVLIKLKTVVQRSLQEVRPILDADGKPTGEYQYDSKGAVGALRLIGDYLGMYSEKVVGAISNGDTYNTQVNVYMPDNQRQVVHVRNPEGNGSARPGGPPSSAPRAAGTLSLPGNGAH